jgi:hypothetical protein
MNEMDIITHPAAGPGELVTEEIEIQLVRVTPKGTMTAGEMEYQEVKEITAQLPLMRQTMARLRAAAKLDQRSISQALSLAAHWE